MLTYHCWVEIRDSPSETEDSGKKLVSAIRAIKDWLATKSYGDLCSDRNIKLGVDVLNGSPTLIGYGCKNHDVGETAELIDLLQFVGEQAPGSYGMLYVLDDENPEMSDLGWKVYVLRRGEVNEHDDPHFSPMIPVVEDPFR